MIDDMMQTRASGLKVHLNEVGLLQFLIQRPSVVLELISLMKLFRECVQEHKQELKIGIKIQEYYQSVRLELVLQQQDSLKEKISKDLHQVHCLVFQFTIRMIAPINITKVTYLSQKQTCLLTLQNQIHSGVFK